MLKEAKKIGLLTREKIVAEIKDRVAQTQACFFIRFNKLGAYPFNTLRNNLRSCGSSVLIARNSLFKRALTEAGWDDHESFLEAETALVFVNDVDVVQTCKILVEFSQEHEALELKGGRIKDKPVTAKEITTLAKLPSREVLLAMAVSGIASPLSGFLTVLNQTILKFVWLVEEIKKVKEQK